MKFMITFKNNNGSLIVDDFYDGTVEGSFTCLINETIVHIPHILIESTYSLSNVDKS